MFLFSPKRLSLLFSFIIGSLLVKAQMPTLPPNGLIADKRGYDVRFQWYADTVNGRPHPHSALLIPVKLPGCRETFYMQFDLGSPISLFYRNKLKSIAEKYPSVWQADDTATQLNGYRFTIGGRTLTATSITVKQFDSSGIDWQKKQKIIGTLGADLIEDKVLVIDYPGRRIRVTDSSAPAIPSSAWQSFMFARRSTLLPAVIKGKKTMLYFDTGSSAFELLTNKATCLSMAQPGAEIVSYPVPSWGRTLTANTVATQDSIRIGGENIPLRHATFIEGTSETQVQRMMSMGIGGMTGNALFLNYRLVLDTRQARFALVKP